MQEFLAAKIKKIALKTHWTCGKPSRKTEEWQITKAVSGKQGGLLPVTDATHPLQITTTTTPQPPQRCAKS